MRRRFDIAQVELRELLDMAEDRRELVAHATDLVRVQPQARQPGDVEDVGVGDRHRRQLSPRGRESADQARARTALACRPLGPCTPSNSTRWPSARALYPSDWISEKWTNTSSAPSCEMKPYPFSLLNHLTVPSATLQSFLELPAIRRSRRAYQAVRRAVAASTVLRRSIAIVIGPTPPGTGVIAPATSLADGKCTSPRRPSSVRLTPTSMTVAPGFTMSPVIISGRPTAAIRMSASRVTAGRSRVREWQTVTVALRCRSRSATGLPTMSDRPTTTAFAPSISTPVRSRSS